MYSQFVIHLKMMCLQSVIHLVMLFENDVFTIGHPSGNVVLQPVAEKPDLLHSISEETEDFSAVYIETLWVLYNATCT